MKAVGLDPIALRFTQLYFPKHSAYIDCRDDPFTDIRIPKLLLLVRRECHEYIREGADCFHKGGAGGLGRRHLVVFRRPSLKSAESVTMVAGAAADLGVELVHVGLELV